MRIAFATNNEHKLAEIRQMLGGSMEVLSLADIGCHADIPETGSTLEENALQKARYVYDNYGISVFADDTGLEVDALGGAPGVYSARYAGEQHDDADNNRKLMVDMAGVPRAQRTCRFASAVALARRGRPTVTAEGACEGLLLDAPRGENGFGYDPYFLYEPAGRSFAELSADEKNAVSHRRRALEALKAALDGERA